MEVMMPSNAIEHAGEAAATEAMTLVAEESVPVDASSSAEKQKTNITAPIQLHEPYQPELVTSAHPNLGSDTRCMSPAIRQQPSSASPPPPPAREGRPSTAMMRAVKKAPPSSLTNPQASEKMVLFDSDAVDDTAAGNSTSPHQVGGTRRTRFHDPYNDATVRRSQGIAVRQSSMSPKQQYRQSTASSAPSVLQHSALYLRPPIRTPTKSLVGPDGTVNTSPATASGSRRRRVASRGAKETNTSADPRYPVYLGRRPDRQTPSPLPGLVVESADSPAVADGQRSTEASSPITTDVRNLYFSPPTTPGPTPNGITSPTTNGSAVLNTSKRIIISRPSNTMTQPRMSELTKPSEAYRIQASHSQQRSAIAKRSRQPHKVLNVYLTKYSVIRKLAGELGFDMETTEDELNGYQFNLCWSDTVLPLTRLVRLGNWQRTNHFPSMFLICKKGHLSSTLGRMRRKLPNHFTFFPRTWSPWNEQAQLTQYIAAARQRRIVKYFILKPESGCQGRGILITRDPLTTITTNALTNYVVQEYLHRPLLLEGKKFDLRVYVLLTSIRHPSIFMFNDGLVRICAEDYEAPTEDNAKQSCKHLTNYAVNKKSAEYIFNTDAEHGDVGNKRNFRFLNRWLEENGHSAAALWEQVGVLVTKTILSAQPNIAQVYDSCFPTCYNDGYCCFEVLGFDVMIDHRLKPWLIEVNHTPSFATDTPLDYDIKSKLIAETWDIIDCKANDYEKDRQREREEFARRNMPPWASNHPLYGTQLASNSRKGGSTDDHDVSELQNGGGSNAAAENGDAMDVPENVCQRREREDSKLKNYSRIYPSPRPEVQVVYDTIQNLAKAECLARPISFSSTSTLPPGSRLTAPTVASTLRGRPAVSSNAPAAATPPVSTTTRVVHRPSTLPLRSPQQPPALLPPTQNAEVDELTSQSSIVHSPITPATVTVAAHEMNAAKHVEDDSAQQRRPSTTGTNLGSSAGISDTDRSATVLQTVLKVSQLVSATRNSSASASHVSTTVSSPSSQQIASLAKPQPQSQTEVTPQPIRVYTPHVLPLVAENSSVSMSPNVSGTIDAAGEKTSRSSGAEGGRATTPVVSQAPELPRRSVVQPASHINATPDSAVSHVAPLKSTVALNPSTLQKERNETQMMKASSPTQANSATSMEGNNAAVNKSEASTSTLASSHSSSRGSETLNDQMPVRKPSHHRDGSIPVIPEPTEEELRRLATLQAQLDYAAAADPEPDSNDSFHLTE